MGAAGQLAAPSLAGFEKATLNLKPNFATADMLANIDHSRSLGLPEIDRPLPANKERLLIVGNGPSTELMLGRLKRQSKRRKTRILAVNGAHAYLLSQGIKPWGHLVMDASPVLAAHIPKTDNGVRYLFASMVHPDTLKAAHGRDIWLWHAFQDLGEQEHLKAAGYDGMLVCGGCTATLRAINLGYLIGFRDFEMYGVDSCYWGERHHANDLGAAAPASLRMKVGDRVFETTGDMAKQAEDFQDLVNRWQALFPGSKVSVHGDGVIVEMMKQRAQRIAERKNA